MGDSEVGENCLSNFRVLMRLMSLWEGVVFMGEVKAPWNKQPLSFYYRYPGCVWPCHLVQKHRRALKCVHYNVRWALLRSGPVHKGVLWAFVGSVISFIETKYKRTIYI